MYCRVPLQPALVVHRNIRGKGTQGRTVRGVAWVQDVEGNDSKGYCEKDPPIHPAPFLRPARSPDCKPILHRGGPVLTFFRDIIPLRLPKYPQFIPISELLHANSQKSATIRKPTFHNGLRLANGAFSGQLFFRRARGFSESEKGKMDMKTGIPDFRTLLRSRIPTGRALQWDQILETGCRSTLFPAGTALPLLAKPE